MKVRGARDNGEVAEMDVWDGAALASLLSEYGVESVTVDRGSLYGEWTYTVIPTPEEDDQ